MGDLVEEVHGLEELVGQTRVQAGLRQRLRPDRCPRVHQRSTDVAHRSGACQGQCVGQLVEDDAEGPRHARTAGHGQGVQDRPAEEDRVGAQRQRRQDVGSGADPPVEEDRGPPRHCGRDLGQDVQGGGDAVELTAAVVRDDQAIGPGVERVERVGSAEDPLNDDREGGEGAQPGQNRPVEPGIELRPAVRGRVGVVAPAPGWQGRCPPAGRSRYGRHEACVPNEACRPSARPPRNQPPRRVRPAPGRSGGRGSSTAETRAAPSQPRRSPRRSGLRTC